MSASYGDFFLPLIAQNIAFVKIIFRITDPGTPVPLNMLPPNHRKHHEQGQPDNRRIDRDLTRTNHRRVNSSTITLNQY